MLFSQRTPDDLSHNRITRALESKTGKEWLDLTESNPTRCGFDYPPELLAALNQPQNLIYDPHPFGHPQARQAVANYLTSKGFQVDPDHLLLTASTSEAYSYLFKVLGNPGDSFLVPTPSYPLLEPLAQLESVELAHFPLRRKTGWPVDWQVLEKVSSTRCKGLVVVNPQNPCGSFLSPEDEKALQSFCGKKDMAYISDEVFADFAYPGQSFVRQIDPEVLSFRLGGLSKSLGMPQLKLAWMVFEGPRKILAECKERLELIADTYLSVNTPVQMALEELLRFAPRFQEQLSRRVLANRAFLTEKLEREPRVRLWPAQGGWYALLEVTGKARDEDWVLELLEQQGVLIQPGGYYNFPKGCFLVLSLLPKPEIFQEGVSRFCRFLGQKAANS
jgi:alanine-synthesizing transaminase